MKNKNITPFVNTIKRNIKLAVKLTSFKYYEHETS
jgi:hypothetical protein